MATNMKKKAARVEEKREKRPYAVAKYVRVSPYKVRTVLDLIRGKSVREAQAILENCVNGGAAPTKKVLMSAFRKVKSQGIVSMLSLASDIYPMLDTDIGIGDMISLGTTALGMEESDIESYRLPADGMYENQTIREMQVLVPDMDANRQYLYELIFGTQDGTAQEGTAGEDGAQ